MIACKTTIGYGAPKKAGTSKAHGEPLGDEEIAGAKKALGWDYGPFEIPEDILADWRAAGARGSAAREAWQKRFAGPAPTRAEFERRMARKRPAALGKAIAGAEGQARGREADASPRARRASWRSR